VYKICIIDLGNELKQRLKTEWAKLDHVVIAAAISSVASLIAPDQSCMFCTPSLAIFPTGFKSGEVGRHS